MKRHASISNHDNIGLFPWIWYASYQPVFVTRGVQYITQMCLLKRFTYTRSKFRFTKTEITVKEQLSTSLATLHQPRQKKGTNTPLPIWCQTVFSKTEFYMIWAKIHPDFSCGKCLNIVEHHWQKLSTLFISLWNKRFIIWVQSLLDERFSWVKLTLSFFFFFFFMKTYVARTLINIASNISVGRRLKIHLNQNIMYVDRHWAFYSCFIFTHGDKNVITCNLLNCPFPGDIGQFDNGKIL